MDRAYASEKLVPGEVYSRAALRDIFKTKDATLNTGVFKPKNYASVFLFVTRKKAKNQPKYVDQLLGDTLHWQGQASGKSDALIIEHQERELELLLFYRNEPKQFPDSGFRYEGRFAYVEHKAARPTSFLLRREGA
jgi:putative restriction endonuclease